MASNSSKPFFLCVSWLVIAAALGILDSTKAQLPGEWITNGPSGTSPWINVLLVDSANTALVYVGTEGRGVLRSADFGLTWLRSEAPLNNQAVTALLLANRTLYLGTKEIGLYRSTDLGKSWQPAAAPMHDKRITCLLAMHDTLYAGTWDDGVFRSTDGGVGWVPANSPLTDKRITLLLADRGRIYAGTLKDGLYWSKDGGMTWQSAGAPMNAKHVVSLIAADGNLYTGTRLLNDGRPDGLYYSQDAGVSWARAPLQNADVTNFAALGSAVYAGTNAGVFFTTDGGSNWQQPDLLKGKRVNALFAAVPAIYAGLEQNGVYRSMDGGFNWLPANSPMDDKRVTALIALRETLYAGTGQSGVFRSTDMGVNWYNPNRFDNVSLRGMLVDLNVIFAYGDNGVFQSKDGGLTWTHVLLPPVDQIILTMFAWKGIIYAGTGSLSGVSLGGVYYSTNNGLTWTQTNAPLKDKEVTNLLALGDTLYAGTGIANDQAYGIYYSTDRGVNWTRANVPAPIKFVTKMIAADGRLYAGTKTHLFLAKPAGVLYSIDGGMNWVQANAPMNDKHVTALLSVDKRLYAGLGGGFNAVNRNQLGIFYSLDGGVNWTQAQAPMQDKEITALTFAHGRLYAGTLANGVYFSVDQGVNWTQANPPMRAQHVRSLVIIKGIVYAGTNRDGMFRSLDNGVNWTPLRFGMGKREIAALAHLSELDRLFAATEDGFYYQTIDLTPPVDVSVEINSGKRFAPGNQVSLKLTARGADSMIVAENATFSNVGWEEFKVARSFPFSPGDGPKAVYAKFKDFSWNESKPISTQIIVDANAPAFFPHSPSGNAKLNQPVTITQAINEANLQSQILFYLRGGEPWHNDRKITFQGNTAVIDGAFITNRGLDYRIFAVDSAENKATLQNGALDFFSLPIELAANDAGSSPGLPAGTGGSSYRLVSLPMKLSGTPSVKSALDIRGKYGKDEEWRFWTYQGNNQWREGENITLQNGEGYFLILRNGGTLTNKIAGTTMETTAGVFGTIPGWRVRANDWTIIGNPYNTRIELSQLKLKGQNKLLSASEVWAYEGSSSNQGWTNEGIALERWSGLAIYSTQADTIVFANSQDPYAKSLSKAFMPLAENLQENEWLVQIRAESGDYSDDVNYFGVRKEASAEQDVYDWYEPPVVPGGISVNFPHAEWLNPASYTSDIRPISKDGYKWQFRVNASGGTAVTLNFKQLETVPNSFKILLLDESNYLLRDLRTQPQVEVRIPQESDAKNLVIFVGKQDFVQSHTAGMRTIPQSLALHQNYPNPFNPTTVIRYELPVPGKVTLKLYNLLGKEVAILENDEPCEPGYYEKVVDLRSFASGIYFYRISVSGKKRFEATKKMVFAK